MKNVILALTAVLALAACDSNRIFRDGVDGRDAAPAQNGTSCSVSQTATGALVSCTDGTSVAISNGSQGPVGNSGTNGSSCSVSQMPNNEGALILCQDGTSVAVLNGTAGATGPAGQNATPVVMQQLCPGAASAFPEQAFVLGGKLYAVYSANGNASLAILTPGTYTTTAPGANCTFTVAADGVTVTH